MAGLATGESIINPDKKLTGAGIDVIVDKAVSIDRGAKKLQLQKGGELPYDKLILATGGRPFIPPIEGKDLKGVFTLRGLPDAEAIRAFLAGETQPKRLLFIGAGFITLEVATLLAASKPDYFDITVVELLSHPLPLMLDDDMAKPLQEYLEGKGIRMKMGEKVQRILGKDGLVTGVELGSGEVIEADLVFLNVGARANAELGQEAGLEMGKFGIKVNEYQETSDPDILACGDCVEKVHFITRKPVPGQLRGPAVIQGRLAAKRLAGFDIAFPGVLNSGGCELFDKTVTSTGLTEAQAVQEGFEVVTATVESRSKHGMIPGMKPCMLKLVFDKKTQKLLGGQFLSDAIAPAKEVDTLSALILGGKTISDLTMLLCAGNPDIASEPSLEPITVAAEQALQKVRAAE